MKKPARDNTLGLVLAGGRATRMGGVNKGLVLFGGEPMANRVIRTLKGQTAAVWVSANRDAEAFYALGADRVFADLRDDRPGPLAALEALTEKVLPEPFEWVLMTPCDVPLVPESLLDVLTEAFERECALTYTIRAAGRDQNAVALVHRSALNHVGDFLSRGDRKLGLWFEETGRVRVPWVGDETVFENVNSPDELKALESRQKDEIF